MLVVKDMPLPSLLSIVLWADPYSVVWAGSELSSHSGSSYTPPICISPELQCTDCNSQRLCLESARGWVHVACRMLKTLCFNGELFSDSTTRLLSCFKMQGWVLVTVWKDSLWLPCCTWTADWHLWGKACLCHFSLCLFPSETEFESSSSQSYAAALLQRHESGQPLVATCRLETWRKPNASLSFPYSALRGVEFGALRGSWCLKIDRELLLFRWHNEAEKQCRGRWWLIYLDWFFFPALLLLFKRVF